MPTMTRTAELASTMRVSVMRLSRRLRTERANHDLTLTQTAALATLERHGPLTPRELADHEHVQPPSMTRTIAALEELGLITRTPHATDGRQHLVALTADARALIKEDRRRRDAWLSQRLAELTQDERELLRTAAQLLDRITRSA
jgi:DNA-binding MarR family transcriptional regulator